MRSLLSLILFILWAEEEEEEVEGDKSRNSLKSVSLMKKAPPFWKTENLWVEDCLVFWKEKENLN